MSEKVSQMALNKFLCKIDPNYMRRNINDVTQWFVKTNLRVSLLKNT